MNPFYVLKIKSNESNRTNIFYWMTPDENYRLHNINRNLDKIKYTYSSVDFNIISKPVRQDKSKLNYRDHIYQDSIDYLYLCGILLLPIRNNQKQLVTNS